MDRTISPKLELGEQVWCRIGILAVRYGKKKYSLISEESPTGREEWEDENRGGGPSHLRDL